MAYTKLSLLVLAACFGHAAAWDYSANGANWEGQCARGGPQSPIDLPISAAVDEEKTVFLKYPKIDTSFQLYHNGHSIALTLPESYKGGFGLGAELDGLNAEGATAYRLWQINFHAPSEHTFQGRKVPLEMQMMHQRVTGGSPETAVVVVGFDNGANTYVDVLDQLMKNGLPQKPWEEKSIAAGIELGDLVGGSPFYHYEGSLTAPPCESSIKYYVRQDPILAANAQLRQFHHVLKKTCGPAGNFRLVHPLSGLLSLMASVDVVKAPGVVAKPKPSAADAAAGAAPPAGEGEDAEHTCSGAFFDKEFKNIGRITVSDTSDMVAAKELFNRQKRELQAAEQGEGNALRSLNAAKAMYANAPGVAEKINLKWGLAGAEAVYSGAVSNLASLSAAKGANYNAIVAAVKAECQRVMSVKEAQRKKDEAAGIVPPAPPAPPPPPTKPVYPEPHVKLPVGLSASPFADKGADDVPTESEVGSDEGSSVATLSRIASNLHCPDVMEGASVTAAEGDTSGKVEDKPPADEVRFKVKLPISVAKMGDKDAFAEGLVKALAAVAHIPASRFEVEEVKKSAVAKVHGSFSLAQEMPMPPSGRLKGTYLRSSQ